MAKISIIQGPNLNLLGMREPELYGRATLQEIHDGLQKAFGQDHQLEFFQSNHEGAIIDAIHKVMNQDGLVINPGAYTHTSYAIRDAIATIQKPAIEIHLTAIYAREAFRQESLIAPVCIGQLSGFGAYGYTLAMQALLQHLA
ncbi:MAG: type II 3-dehydroquinate dehydratase [Myxococcaceae bacterium]